jgi:8-oxo-dGTP pyrophosphatase MutT (NUDIX family)
MTPKQLDQPLPHFTVMAFPFDPSTQEVAMLWRGESVRSAKNCLSTPAGLLEHGESFTDGLIRELQEEMGLDPKEIISIKFRTIYKNSNDDGFDWVIGVWDVAVENLRNCVVNAEPDKHDHLVFMNLEELLLDSPRLEDGSPAIFASNLQPVLKEVARSIYMETFLKTATISLP